MIFHSKTLLTNYLENKERQIIMNQIRQIHEIKEIAKDKLLGNYRLAVLAILLIQLVTIVIRDLSSTLFRTETFVTSILNLLFLFISLTLLEIFSIGKANLFLNLMTNREAKLQNLYVGFQKNTSQGIILCGIRTLITSIAFTVPSTLFMNFAFQEDHPITTLITTIVFLIGTIITIYLLLTISQVFYLFNDFPDLSAIDAIKFSCKITKGHRLRLFYLHISFVPWYLLSILTLGLGLLWIVPYLQSSLTLFYLNLIEIQQKNGKH